MYNVIIALEENIGLLYYWSETDSVHSENLVYKMCNELSIKVKTVQVELEDLTALMQETNKLLELVQD